MKILLSLDYSTSATGYAKFDMATKKLISYGVIKPDFKNPTVKGIPKYNYPRFQLLKLRRLAEQILEIIDERVEKIVIEEINGSKNRLGQKVLDAGHFILLDRMRASDLSKVIYMNSDGNDGWRSKAHLGLQLSSTDKLVNKDRKKFNSKLGKGGKKQPLITQKTLSCAYVNKRYGLKLDCDNNATDNDLADAIAMGHAFIKTMI